MKYAIYLLAIFLLLGLNLGLFNNLQIRGQLPNLLFLLVLCFSLEKKDLDFFFIAAASGLFLDFYSTGFFGGFTLALLLIALGIHFVVNNLVVFELNWKTLGAALFISFLVFSLLIWLWGFLAFRLDWSAQYTGFGIFLSAFPAGFIYNALLLYPVYVFVTFLRRTVDNLSLRRRKVL